MAIEGFHFTLSHALLPATEGVLTDASGAVVRFNDSAATILTEFCSAGTGSSSCPIFLVFHDGTSPFYSTSGGDSGGDTQGTYSISVVSNGSQIPLPTALPLFATGLGLMGLLGWRRKRRAAA